MDESKAIFAYRNKIKYSGDDAIEFDYSDRNNAFYDNYILNCATGISIDGVYGGPVYAFRNRFINTRRYQIKCGDKATGVLIYNNTWAHTEGDSSSDQRRGWYWSQTAIPRGWEYRNNLVLWEGSSDIMRFDGELSSFTPLVMTHNGWSRNGTNIYYAGSGLPVGSVADMQANSNLGEIHDNDIEITSQATALETPVVFGADWETAITIEYDLSLRLGSQANSAGISLPNINSTTNIGADQNGFPTVGNRYFPGLPSWANIPSGEINVVNSGTTVSSSISAAGGNSYPGTSPLDITIPWSGGALIEYNGDEYLLVAGGGHGDSSWNGHVGFGPLDSESPIWQVIFPASASGDVVADSVLYADGRQGAQHTYDNLVGVGDTLYHMACGALYGPSGNGSSRAFKVVNGTTESEIATNPQAGAAIGATAYYNGKIYWITGNNSFDKLQIYDIASNTWSQESNSDIAVPNYVTAAADSSRGGLYATNGSSAYYWDLSTLSRSSVNAPPQYEQAIVYDSNRDVFVSIDNGSSTLYELDAGSLYAGGNPSWSSRTYTGSPISGTHSQGTFGRFQYVESLQGYLVVPNAGSHVWFIKS